jgi:anti-sigma regulatory factor (Ser/Thr protein kinase)
MLLNPSGANPSRPPFSTRIAVTELTQAGEARRVARSIVQDAGFDAAFCSNASIVVSELATNLARYANEGEVLLQLDRNGEHSWLDVLAIDRGPGIENLPRSMTDGYSTGGTAGNGLGAVSRLATAFDVHSARPGGTIAFARLQDRVPPGLCRARWGAVCLPMKYESACGDMWRICEQDGRLSVLLVDGLGHGPEAAAAAHEAVAVFDQHPFEEPTALAKAIDARMRGTRGGAMALAHVDSDKRSLRYVGIGNISGSLRDSSGAPGRGLFSHHGIVGVQLRKVQEFEYPLPARGFLIMHSDGLRARWSFDNYPGLLRRHPGVVAGTLYRDFSRGRDDVTVAVIELPAEA